MNTYCKKAKLTLNFDMNGMVQPCELTNYYFEKNDGSKFNVLNDDVMTIWNSEHRKKLISDHENGVRSPTCKLCWDQEDANLESTRQKFNKSLTDVEDVETQPRVIILKPGNKCNNACRSCNAHTSSMWYKTDYALDDQGKTFKEYLKFFDRHKTAYNNNTQLEKRFAEWEDKIVAWDMFGGEPMIVPMFFNILDQAVANKNVGDKTFHVHTNGMVYKEGLMDKFSKFKHATMGFSVDAIGIKNDYIRYGSKWENIIGNLNNYVKDSEKYENIQLAIRTTLTPWNIYHYDETFDYFQKLGIIPSVTWCWDEPWNDVRYLPNNIKDAVLEKLSKYNSEHKNWTRTFDYMKKWMASEPSDYSEKQNSFIEFNTKIDNIRKEKFNDVFPEYSKLFA